MIAPPHGPGARALPPAPRPGILLVDDDEFTTMAVKLVVATAGFDLHAAANADEALQALQDRGFDLVLLDIGLPGISGVELLRRMRAAPALAKVPVLMLTGHRDKRTIVESMAAGANDFIVKPFARDLLLGKIVRLVRGGAAGPHQSPHQSPH